MNTDYQAWLDRYDVLRADDIDAIRRDAATINLAPPKILIRFDRDTESNLSRALQGLQDQALPDWRALVYLDETCSLESRMLARERCAGDARISLITTFSESEPHLEGHHATAVFASGSVILREHALYMFARLARDHATAIVYSDEDHLGENGERQSPRFKPKFSSELFKQICYLGNCILLKSDPAALESAAADFAIRLPDFSGFIDAQIRRIGAENVLHVPHVLFHDTASCTPKKIESTNDLQDAALPSVSIVIPTKDHLELIKACLESIRAQTDYSKDRYELVVIDNGSEDPAALSYLAEARQAGHIRLLRDTDAFNFSRINNRAVTSCTNEILLFLNNDIEVIDPTWIRRLVAYATKPDVGVVGCKLLYPDATVQHGGMVLGIRGSAVHAHVGIHRDEPGFQGLACLTREVSAVTGACMAIRRALFQSLGGFDEELEVAFNDTDLCLRAHARGLRNIFVGVPLAIHHEGKTRGRDDTPQKTARFRFEAAVARRRHAGLYKDDPYYNLNLSVDRVHELGFPPRRTLPWKIPKPPAPLNILWVASPPSVRAPDLRAIRIHLQRLRDAGYRVRVASELDLSFVLPDYPNIVVSSPRQVADFVVLNDIHCIILDDPCFLAVARLIGEWPLVICCDCGQLPEELFPDVRAHLEDQNAIAFLMAHAIVDSPPRQDPDSDANANCQWTSELLGIIRSLHVSRSAERPVDRHEIKSPPRPPFDDGPHRSTDRQYQNREGFYTKLSDLEGAALIDQLYLSVLGRYADPAGRETYMRRIERGMPKRAVIWEVASSDEAKARGVNPSAVMWLAGFSDTSNHERRSRLQDAEYHPSKSKFSVSELLKLNDPNFIDGLYREILGREPDADGHSHYLSLLRSGFSKLEVLSQITVSAEARERHVRIPGYRTLLMRNSLARLFRLFTRLTS